MKDVFCTPLSTFLLYNKQMKERVELHCHTTMSAMDGVATPKEVVEYAKKNGMKAVAITDHGNIWGHQELPHYLDKDDEFTLFVFGRKNE